MSREGSLPPSRRSLESRSGCDRHLRRKPDIFPMETRLPTIEPRCGCSKPPLEQPRNSTKYRPEYDDGCRFHSTGHRSTSRAFPLRISKIHRSGNLPVACFSVLEYFILSLGHIQCECYTFV